MENYCRYGASSSHPPHFYVGAFSSKASFPNLKINVLQKDLETKSPNGSRNASKKRVQLTRHEEDEHESKCYRVVNLATNDSKELRRIANRMSAQRSRQRKQEYQKMLEEKAKYLEQTITRLTEEKETVTRKNQLLQFEKNILDQKIYRLVLKSKIRERNIEKNKVEIMNTKELQNLGRNENVELDLSLSLSLPGKNKRFNL